MIKKHALSSFLIPSSAVSDTLTHLKTRKLALKMSALIFSLALLEGCGKNDEQMNGTVEKETAQTTSVQADKTSTAKKEEEFKVIVDRFADVQILRYPVPGFESLDFKKKELLYYLYEAALSGRDIMWDQNNSYNLRIRQVIRNVHEITSRFRFRCIPPGVVAKSRRRPTMPSILRLARRAPRNRNREVIPCPSLKQIIRLYPGDKNSEDFQTLLTYAKQKSILKPRKI